MKNLSSRILPLAIVIAHCFLSSPCASAYEVVVDLGSTAGKDITIAMGDRRQWPFVADNTWGIVANYVPLASLTESQRVAVLNTPRNKRAIVEIPYRDIAWGGNQGHIDYIEHYGYSTPYLLILNESNANSVMSRDEINRVKTRFPDKTIIMNTRSWEDNGVLVQSETDILDGVCIEYIPTNNAYNIKKHVAPFFEWAYKNNKILFFLMPPQPDDYIGTRYVDGVKQAAQAIYDYNKTRLPKGWMASNKFMFLPANYTYGISRLHYVPENGPNTVLGAAKALMDMRPQLDAIAEPAPSSPLPPTYLLLLQ